MMKNMIGLRLNPTCSHWAAPAMVGRDTGVEITKRLVDTGAKCARVDDYGMTLLYYRNETYGSGYFTD